jgi:hypothetical protein
MVGSPFLSLLLADARQAQLLMVAGFIMLGWVLARRQIRARDRAVRQARADDRDSHRGRESREPSLPLADAPAETQRWQVAMLDLQRELKADLDTRIAVVQALVRQADERIARLSSLQSDAVQRSTDPIGKSLDATATKQ